MLGLFASEGRKVFLVKWQTVKFQNLNSDHIIGKPIIIRAQLCGFPLSLPCRRVVILVATLCALCADESLVVEQVVTARASNKLDPQELIREKH